MSSPMRIKGEWLQHRRNILARRTGIAILVTKVWRAKSSSQAVAKSLFSGCKFATTNVVAHVVAKFATI
ncbi:hypothetical protein CCACVL1_04000 [Corchorus capsularis]|uniref:Uncharacterized protein n=1 Tax=Corchorus capsularis TaxID=210143 RepID=A0A1R3JVR0_COCAP|nr:hypothetical protein CCACVL1_04000 [Corchorus capsularis]